VKIKVQKTFTGNSLEKQLEERGTGAAEHRNRIEQGSLNLSFCL